MSEDEKEAIECLELVLDNETDIETEDLTNKCINNILNLIKKQQKQIEKLLNIKLYACDENKNKECDKKHCYINGGGCDATTDITKVKYINLDNYIHKDKITAVIEQIKLRKMSNEEIKQAVINLLQSLLE